MFSLWKWRDSCMLDLVYAPNATRGLDAINGLFLEKFFHLKFGTAPNGFALFFLF